jgi:site-specific recombinase XerD
MDLERMTQEYAIWHEVSGHSTNTINLYRWVLGSFRAWLAEHGRSTNIMDITLADARAFLLHEQQRDSRMPPKPGTTSRTKKLSDRTIHIHARSLRAFFNWLVAEEYLTTNPLAKLKNPKLEHRMKEVLSVDEVERLIAECNPKTFYGSRSFAIVAILYDSGLRAGELSALDLHDVDWAGYHLRVMGKGRKERLVPFSPTTHKALRRYVTHREDWALTGETALFVTAEGHRLSRDAVTRLVKRLGQRAGVSRLHPHLLRHSAAVAAIMNGADQFALKRILGHSQLSTTDVYVDYAQQHLAERHKQFSPMARVNERRARAPKKKRT